MQLPHKHYTSQNNTAYRPYLCNLVQSVYSMPVFLLHCEKKIFHTNTIILLKLKQNRFVPRLTTATHKCYTGKMKPTGKGEAGGNATPSAAWRLELETIVTITWYYGQSQLLLCNSRRGVYKKRKRTWQNVGGEVSTCQGCFDCSNTMTVMLRWRGEGSFRDTDGLIAGFQAFILQKCLEQHDVCQIYLISTHLVTKRQILMSILNL